METNELWTIEELLNFSHTVHMEPIEFRGRTLMVPWHELEAAEVPSMKGYEAKGDNDKEKQADLLFHAMTEKVWAMIDKGQKVSGKVLMTRAQFDALPDAVRNDIISTILDLRKKMEKSFLGGDGKA
jgi:hypothetical protein